MVRSCAVFNCSNKSTREKEHSFFHIPAVITRSDEKTRRLSEARRRKWVAAIWRKDLRLTKYCLVCSDHFVSGKPSALFDTCNPDWAPTLNMGHDHGSASATASARYKRATSRKRLRSPTDTNDGSSTSAEGDADEASNGERNAEVVDDMNSTGEAESGVGTVTELTMDTVENVMRDNVALRAEVGELRDRLKEMSLDEDAFRDNDEKVAFYTGLPTWHVLMTLLSFVSQCLPSSARCVLSPFRQLLLTLMKLRLNLPAQDLSVRFGVSVATVSRTFLLVLNVLYGRLKPLIIWPDRDVLRKTLPMCFRTYCPQAVVIIDCFEIFVDRPLNPLARAQTYSSYKHHNTVKFLIGITPQGSVSYISEGWGGRASDKHLTEMGGLLDNLVPGDVILADRGFDIREAVGLFCATVRIPAFTRGKKQLSGVEVEQTRRIANVRIHVERVIGLLRNKYAILGATQPIDFLVVPNAECHSTISKMVTVCCALINMCNSVVPSD